MWLSMDHTDCLNPIPVLTFMSCTAIPKWLYLDLSILICKMGKTTGPTSSGMWNAKGPGKCLEQSKCCANAGRCREGTLWAHGVKMSSYKTIGIQKGSFSSFLLLYLNCMVKCKNKQKDILMLVHLRPPQFQAKFLNTKMTHEIQF